MDFEAEARDQNNMLDGMVTTNHICTAVPLTQIEGRDACGANMPCVNRRIPTSMASPVRWEVRGGPVGLFDP